MRTQNRHQTALALFTLVLGLSLIIPAAADSFTNTGSLSTGRENHTATLLASGKVLVAGGVTLGNIYPSDTELYDPAIRTWAATGSVNTARQNHTATLLADGKVLVVGGYNNNDTTTSAELYDPVTGTWTATGSLNNKRHAHTATLLADGKVLVAGGINSTGSLSSVEIYDPATGTWTATGSLNTQRYDPSATLLANGILLVAGGHDGSSTHSLSSAELYDPVTGTWTVTGSMNNIRYKHTAILLANGQAMVVGGLHNYSGVELYDPVTGTWTTTGSLNSERFGNTATLLADGKVLVAGGFSGVILSSAELYDPATHAWTVSSAMNTPRYSHTATLLPNGSVLTVGGASGTGPALSSAELFNAGIFFTAQPQSQVVYWGKSTTLSITVTGGVLPLTYQWLKDGMEIDGATNSALAFPNVQTTDTGSYTVVVTDANNNTLTSQVANLTVNPAGVSIATYAGLTIDGVTGQTYGIQATTDLGGSGSWTGVANVTLTQPSQIWYDSQSTAQQPKRFYRVVAGPISIP